MASLIWLLTPLGSRSMAQEKFISARWVLPSFLCTFKGNPCPCDFSDPLQGTWVTLPPQHPLLPLYAMFQFSSSLMPLGVPTNSAMAAGQTTPNLLQFLTMHVMSVIFHTNMDSTNTFTFLSLLHTYTFLLDEFCACILSSRVKNAQGRLKAKQWQPSQPGVKTHLAHEEVNQGLCRNYLLQVF